MRDKIISLVVLLVMVTACTPGNMPDSTVNPPTMESGQVATATIDLKTEVPATATVQPTAAPTPLPALFDRAGYRQFAITRSYFQGWEDYRAERAYTEISSALSPDGNKIAISACWGSMDSNWRCETRRSGFLVVIDVNTGELLNEIPVGNGWPGPLAFTPDGRYLLFSTEEYKITLWDLVDNKPAKVLLDLARSGSTLFPDVAVAPDGSSLSAVAGDRLYVWDATGEMLLEAPAYNARATAALGYSLDGSRLILFSPDRQGIDVYDTSTWKITQTITLSDIWDAEISPDGRFVAIVMMNENAVAIWDTTTGERLPNINPELRLNSLQFNPAGDLLIVGGYGNLDTKDGYSVIGELFETQTWSKVDMLYSYTSEGKFRFNKDGSRMVMLGSYATTVWELPDAELLAGLEVGKQFQSALANKDYDSAASLFDATTGSMDFLVDSGFDANDVAGSFERLCTAEIIFCKPVKDLVLMGYDWEDIVYMVRLEDSSGKIYMSPGGATILNLYLQVGENTQPRVIYPAMD